MYINDTIVGLSKVIRNPSGAKRLKDEKSSLHSTEQTRTLGTTMLL